MAVSFRVTGTWAELVADGTVAIPATPQAGDRMYLFARWKDFAITAQITSPSGWTKLTEFTDGSTSSGNGTGSVKVACWYRDWQSGDTDPAVDFSSSPTNASVVIMVMAKAATDTWLTPVAVTAAMSNWTTSSQTVSASSTANVLGGGVVMGLIGIRDDSATMTRPTTGIDDSTGAITWNGDYVESPATHHSTTTGDDGSADLGYRLVTEGATATLRMTGTISASETGAGLWVVQGVQANLLINNAAHSHATANAVLTQSHSLAVANAAHAQSAGNLVLTQDHTLAIQAATHSHTAGNLSFTQVHSLSLQAGSHAHSATSPTLAVAHNLIIQEAAHDHTAVSPTLAVIYALTVNNALHSHTGENFDITQDHNLTIEDGSHTHTAQSPNVRTFQIIYLDPGGDAVQAPGYFNTLMTGSSGTVSFDSAQQIIGIGSYKFDSGANEKSAVTVSDVLGGVSGATRRISTYFRYSSVADVINTVTEFVADNAIYSGGGFSSAGNISAADGVYSLATPARNAGQGSKCSVISPLNIPFSAIIDSVKIIYQRQYDLDTSIGISRVKWVLDGVEGPNHDNTDMPLTDTVVEVDVTGDFSWEAQHFIAGESGPRFEIVAEARRGDTDIEHTQSWDYVKVEVQYHQPVTILQGRHFSTLGFRVSLRVRSDGVVLRLTDNTEAFYDGITKLAVDTWYRLSLSYVELTPGELTLDLNIDNIFEMVMFIATEGWDWPLHLDFGWVSTPGTDHFCWFDQLYIDDGDDLLDPGDARITAKLPASVNENNWDTTIGTGAVNERPLSETNYMQHAAATTVRQTYTLQTAAAGDVDIASESLIGYMGWAWAKVGSGDVGAVYLVTNNIEQFSVVSTSAGLLKFPVKTVAYPSHAAGIGMVSNDESFFSADTFMYECGAVIAFTGPNISSRRILIYQEYPEGTILDLVDDLRANPPDPPDNYEFCYRSEESITAAAMITVTSLDQEGGTIRQQMSEFALSNNNPGRSRINAGIEVQIHVEIVGGPIKLGLWHRLNVDT